VYKQVRKSKVNMLYLISLCNIFLVYVGTRALVHNTWANTCPLCCINLHLCGLILREKILAKSSCQNWLIICM